MSAIFCTPEDKNEQLKAEARLEVEWGCQIQFKGDLAPVDWHFRQRTNWPPITVGEFKRRYNPSNAYPTLYLCARKYNDLIAERNRYGVPAVYVVQYDDTMKWINVNDVDPVTMLSKEPKGRDPRPGSTHDQELMLEIPVGLLKLTDQSPFTAL